MARVHDVIVWGANGFTGRLVAEHLAKHYTGPEAATKVRWAMAGRDRAKLEATRAALAKKHPAAADVPVLDADMSDPASLDKVLSTSKVVLTLAGPYARVGAPLVAAAVRCGTHYTDITGEPQFMLQNVKLHDASARANGTCVVSACGYDSVPWDLGTMLAVKHLRSCGVTGGVSVAGYVGSTAGGFSGGTVASLLGALDDPTARALSGSHSLDPEWAPRPDAGPQMTPRYSPPGRRWTIPSIMAAVNEKVVNRSAALKPDLYGQRGSFDYNEATLVPNAVGAAIGGALMATAGLLLALPPTRWLLMKTVLPAPGQGPSEAMREGGVFTAHFVATETEPSAGAKPRRAFARIAARADPGYKGTSIMAAEAALCLALQKDELPGAIGGVITPATCMGDTLLARLRAQGFDVSVRDFGDDEVVPDA